MLAQIAALGRSGRVSASPTRGCGCAQDVYAMHGHYLDAHLTIPTLERLGVGVMGRLLERPAERVRQRRGLRGGDRPDLRLARRDHPLRAAGPALNGLATVARVAGARAAAARRDAAEVRERRRQATARSARAAAAAGRAIKRAFPLMVAALNRAGLGPLSADISRAELRRAGLRAMGEVAARLELGDAYVVFGHTHRAGPFPGDDESEWRGRGGARLVNSRLLGLRRGLPHARPPAKPLLARHVRARGGHRPAACSSDCCWTARTRSSGREYSPVPEKAA